MANAFLIRVAAVARKSGADTVDDLWGEIGRPDLAGSTHESLRGAPILQSALAIFEKSRTTRIETRTAPLTEFVLEPLERVWVNTKLVHRLSGKIELWNLHSTKGWRRTKIDAADRDHAVNEKRTPLLRAWPKSGIVRSAA